jgi:hypothetical protein
VSIQITDISRIFTYASLLIVVSLVALYFLNDGFAGGVDEAYAVLTSDDRARIPNSSNRP